MAVGYSAGAVCLTLPVSMSSQRPIQMRDLMFTDGKTLTDLTAISFYMLDVRSPTIFS
jgi:peptidase E